MPEITITLTDAKSGDLIATSTLTDEESIALMLYAKNERRDPSAQAAVFISEAVGCWHTTEPANESSKQVSKRKRVRDKAVATNGAARTEL